MAPYSGDILNAVIAKLVGDATLRALMPDGVYYDIASSGKTRFLVVKWMSHTITRKFGGRAFEAPAILVKAVEFGTGTVNTESAARRISVLFDGPNGEGSTLTVPGYGFADTVADEMVKYTEPDPSNADARWQHNGWIIAVFASPT